MLLALVLLGCPDPKPDGGTAHDDDSGTPASCVPVAETCNGADDDCDGAVDEDADDALEFFLDGDADGVGDASILACALPDGAAVEGGDCDDADAGVFPGASETCDGRDEDCDGEIDEQAVDAVAFYTDGDGDGFGDAVVYDCALPAGASELDGDCDDGDATVFPGAVETCDGVDQDCDGEVDEDAADASPWYTDADADGFGDGVVYACALPADASETAGDCDDLDPDRHPGAPETCDEVDEDCDGEIDEDAVDLAAWYTDADADGYGDAVVYACALPAGAAAASGDCDDGDAGVSPAGVETCDGVDQDCDGAVDEDAVDASTWYTDADGDGFGDVAVLACDAPADASATAGDCDDANADVFPGAVEHCDGVDEDCDGTADDDAVDPGTWYTDADGDGFGAGAVTGCTQPSGTASTDGDCNDADATAWPGADETCDGVDDDCDGVVDDDPVGTPTWHVDADGDGYGSSVAIASCDTPASATTDAQDCDDGDAAVHPGVEEICWNGYDDDCDGLDSTDSECAPSGVFTADVLLAGLAAGDAAGTSVSMGDVDGDGLADWLVGAPGADTAYLLLGSRWNVWSVLGLSAADATFTGAGDFGTAVAIVRDLDGDGVDDVAIGAPGDDTIATDAGAVSIWYGGALSGALSTPDLVLYGEATTDAFGTAVASAGDVDADGLGDLVVGAPGRDSPASDGGGAYLFLGADVAGGEAATVFTAELDGDGVGTTVAGVGDLDADGYDDFAIGAPAADDVGVTLGEVYLVYGPVDAGRVHLARLPSIRGDADGDAVGTAVAGAGDVDGDGYDDLLVGATGVDTTYAASGRVGVFYGPVPKVRRTFATADWTIDGDEASSGMGAAVAGGDVDGDGRADVVAGAPDDDSGAAGAGRVALAYGPGSAVDAVAYGTSSTEGSGVALATGDVDGDGYDEVAIGAPDADPGGRSGAGQVRLVFGGSREEAVATPPTISADDDADGDGLTEAGGDCDDTRAEVYDGATETCGDELDEDCDGFDPPCPSSGTSTASALTTAVWGSNDLLVPVGDLDGDGFADLVNYGSSGVAIHLGPVPHGVSYGLRADTILSYPVVPTAIAGAGDLDGDGDDELVLGVPGDDGAATDAGAVLVFYGRDEWPDTLTSADADIRIEGQAASEYLGYGPHSIAFDSDLDGDGTIDLVIGQYRDDGHGTDAGAVYVFSGASLTAGTWSTADATVTFRGDHAGDELGYAVGTGSDLGADGTDDLVAIVRDSTEYDDAAGGAVVWTGPLDTSADALAEDADIHLADEYELSDVLVPGDLDLDGYDDLLVWGYNSHEWTVVPGPLVRGSHVQLPDETELLLDLRLAFGDFDGDGYPDLLAGNSLASGGGQGWIHYGPLDLTTTYAVADADASWAGSGSGRMLGEIVEAADLDGDGIDEALMVAGGETSYIDDCPAFVAWGGRATGTVPASATVRSTATDDDGDGYSEDDGDCADDRADISPGATEVCGDVTELDEDCDGRPEWCAPEGTGYFEDGPVRLEADRSVGVLLGADDFDGDGEIDVVVGGPDDSPAAVYVAYGPMLYGLTRLQDESYVATISSTYTDFGEVGVVDDVDGDGVTDILAWDPGSDTVLRFDDLSGRGDATTADAATVWTAGTSTDGFGTSIAAGADQDGDGIPDLAVGAPYTTVGANTYAGTTYLYAGDGTGTVPVGDAAVVLQGNARSDMAGYGQALGDLDGDGLAEIVTGIYGLDAGANNVGAVCVWPGGTAAGTYSLADADAFLEGKLLNDDVYASEILPDTDADGLDELAVYHSLADEGLSNNGAVYVFRGGAPTGVASADTASLHLVGTYAGDVAADDVDVADLDGDGADDLLVGNGSYTAGHFGWRKGSLSVFYDPASLTGTVSLDDADAFYTGGTLVGEVGSRLLPVGDVDGDGTDDVLVTNDGTNLLLFGGI